MTDMIVPGILSQQWGDISAAGWTPEVGQLTWWLRATVNTSILILVLFRFQLNWNYIDTCWNFSLKNPSTPGSFRSVWEWVSGGDWLGQPGYSVCYGTCICICCIHFIYYELWWLDTGQLGCGSNLSPFTDLHNAHTTTTHWAPYIV